MDYRETTDTCCGCGAEAATRLANMPGEPQGLALCPWCGAEKCCMCGMGDDLACASCEGGR